MDSNHAGPIRVGYLNTQYPSLSHTFIEREIRAIREQGIEVKTFSIRRCDCLDRLSKSDQDEARRTQYILDGIAFPVCLLVWALFTRPLSWLRVAKASQRLSSPGLLSRLKHFIYASESIVLARLMRRKGLRHVHVHMANNGAAVAMLATVFDRSLSYSLTIHGSAEFFNVEEGGLKPKAESALFVRCISDFCQAQVKIWTNRQAWKRYHIVHCGVDIDSFKGRALGSEGPLRMITVGRLVPIKGYSVLFEACQKLSEAGVDWRLDMVGDGPMWSELTVLANQLCIADRVTFSGAVGQDRIQDHYDAAHVLIVSSFMEGVPVVLMEAMAKQMAVVSTCVGGVPELVKDGESGLLVTPGSVGALVKPLMHLTKDRESLKRLGQSARRRIIDEYSIQQIGVQMAELFRRYIT